MPSGTTIRRGKHTHDFTVLTNSIFDSGLTLEELGLLCYLLSRQENWVIRQVALKNLFRCGAHTIKKTINGLIERGYIRRSIARGDAGRFDHIEHVVFDDPTPPLAENRLAVNPLADLPLAANQPPTKNKHQQELTQKNTFPGTGPIRWSEPWASIARTARLADGCAADPDAVADDFRRWWASRGNTLQDPRTEKAFSTFSSKWRGR